MTQLFGHIAATPHICRKIGYARVSTADQNLDMQFDALKQAGCERIFADHGISGAKGKRPGLDGALRELVSGDLLVVYRLDRLGRSVFHLSDLLTYMSNEDIHFCSLTEGINTATSGGRLIYHIFAAVAEFHRDLIRENTILGLQAARQRGAKIGRPRLIDDNGVMEAHRFMHQEGKSIEEAAHRFNVSRYTLARWFERLDLYEAA